MQKSSLCTNFPSNLRENWKRSQINLSNTRHSPPRKFKPIFWCLPLLFPPSYILLFCLWIFFSFLVPFSLKHAMEFTHIATVPCVCMCACLCVHVCVVLKFSFLRSTTIIPVQRVFVTPTRTLVLPPIPEVSNRILRQHANLGGLFCSMYKYYNNISITRSYSSVYTCTCGGV